MMKLRMGGRNGLLSFAMLPDNSKAGLGASAVRRWWLQNGQGVDIFSGRGLTSSWGFRGFALVICAAPSL